MAANRGVEPRRLSGQVRWELDWVVMKALEKDRNRRYETASGFAADVQRYLAGEAVLAVPPSAGYRLRKFARRNRRALATAGVLMVALLATVITLGGLVVVVAASRFLRRRFHGNRFTSQESFWAATPRQSSFARPIGR